MRIDTNLGMRAALAQAGAVLVLGLATGLTLSHSFFEDGAGWSARAPGCSPRSRPR